MINENENTQPELNMVSEEPTAPVAEPQTEPQTETVTATAVESTADPATESATKENVTTETSAPKAEEAVGTYPSTVDPDNSVQQTLQQTQQRLQQVEQQNLQNQMLYETENYKQQLAQQGYNNEQIQFAADTYYQNRVQQAQVEQNYQKGLQFKEGQFKASLQFGKKYNVSEIISSTDIKKTPLFKGYKASKNWAGLHVYKEKGKGGIILIDNKEVSKWYDGLYKFTRTKKILDGIIKKTKKEMSDASYAINRGVGEKAEKEFTNLSHRLFYLENFKQFDSKADFFDFVLLHHM